jgi:thiosulfate/3-mercaptopyruvate sulfurtransferase
MNSESVCTLNALQPEVFTGEVAPYGRAGHIPGSHNVYSSSLLDSDTGVFLPLDQLKERFEVSGVMKKPRAILYCGGGVSATVGALALTLLGHPDIAVYDGSMTDWVQDPSLPLVCGA